MAMAPGMGKGDPRAAMREFKEALIKLAESDFTGFGWHDELLDFGDDLFEAERTLHAVTYAYVQEADDFGVPDLVRERDMRAVLHHRHRLSGAEAKRLVEETALYAATRSMQGEVLPAKRPATAAALADGAISRVHAEVIEKHLRQIPASMGPDIVAVAEADMAGRARQFNPEDTATCCKHTLDHLDPDGLPPADEVDHQANRKVKRGQDRDGMGVGSFRATPILDARLGVVFSHYGKLPPGVEDTRTVEQRQHDALNDFLGQHLAEKGSPHRGEFGSVTILKIELQQLQDLTDTVTTALGGEMTIEDAMRLACDSGVIPVVFNGSAPLWCGKDTRYANRWQRAVMLWRDGGCTRPGCTTPGQWCDAHHLPRWEKTKRTWINELTLECGFDHALIDKLEADGWEIRQENGVTLYIPPENIDPERRPRVNWKHHPDRKPGKGLTDP